MRWDVELFWKSISTASQKSCTLEISTSGPNFLAPNGFGKEMGDLVQHSHFKLPKKGTLGRKFLE